ncbi:MAG: fimbrillin family protein [Phocaeicola sp.]
MKTSKLVISFAAMIAASSAFFGCSNEEDSLFHYDGSINFSSNVLNSRAIGQDIQSAQIASGVTVGIFATTDEAGTTPLENGTNASFIADGNGGLTAATSIYWPASGSVYFNAYAPLQEDWLLNDANTFTVKADQSSDANYIASDLLYAVPATNPVDKRETVVLPFTHKLSKINISVTSSVAEIDLKGATVSLLNILPSISFTPQGGVIGAASGSATSIKAATFSSDATSFDCSAVVVPQTFTAGSQFIQIITASNRTFYCTLSSAMTFESGRAYGYKLKISESGVEITKSSTLANWDKGADDVNLDLEEEVTYGVGDFLLADGSFAKAKELTDATKATALGVIFSTEVSTEDAEAGYKGYVLSFEKKTGLKWSTITTLVDDLATPLSVDAAISALNGLSETVYYQSITEEYPLFSDFSTDLPTDLDSSKFSGWFVPSIGQWIQILNNLGNAEIKLGAYTKGRLQVFPNATDDEIATFNTNNPTSSAFIANKLVGASEIVASINSYATYINKTIENIVYTSSTQANASNMWVIGLSGLSNNAFANVTNSWEISNQAGKSNATRNILPVIAYK